MITTSPLSEWLRSCIAAFGQFRRDLPTKTSRATGITGVRKPGAPMPQRAGANPASGPRAVIANNPDAMPSGIAREWKLACATSVRFDHSRARGAADAAVRKA
jgi:hypothetical protein